MTYIHETSWGPSGPSHPYLSLSVVRFYTLLCTRTHEEDRQTETPMLPRLMTTIPDEEEDWAFDGCVSLKWFFAFRQPAGCLESWDLGWSWSWLGAREMWEKVWEEPLVRMAVLVWSLIVEALSGNVKFKPLLTSIGFAFHYYQPTLHLWLFGHQGDFDS